MQFSDEIAEIKIAVCNWNRMLGKTGKTHARAQMNEWDQFPIGRPMLRPIWLNSLCRARQTASCVEHCDSAERVPTSRLSNSLAHSSLLPRLTFRSLCYAQSHARLASLLLLIGLCLFSLFFRLIRSFACFSIVILFVWHAAKATSELNRMKNVKYSSRVCVFGVVCVVIGAVAATAVACASILFFLHLVYSVFFFPPFFFSNRRLLLLSLIFIISYD